MQGKNEKILGIMENNASLSSSVDSLIEQFEIEKEMLDRKILNSRKLTIQATNTGHSLEITKETDPDIDKNITELENLIKRLQSELKLQVEMNATASRPLSLHGSFIAQKEESSKSNIGSKKQKASNALSELSNKADEPESQNDGKLEDQVDTCSDNDSNTINEDNQKDAIDDVRWDFSVLLDDPTKTSNLDVAEKTIETGSNKPSLKNNNSISTDGISTESTNNKSQIELTNYSMFFEGTFPNHEVFPNNTRDDDKKISSIHAFNVDSITNGVISEIVYEDVTENIMDNVPVLLNAETTSNLSGKNIMSIEIKESNIEKHPSNVVNKTDLKSSATDLPKPGTVAAIKTKMENLGSSDNISAPVTNHVIPTSATCELRQTQSVNTEKTEKDIPKTDSLLKTFNRKLRQIVGITSEKSISQDKHNSEDNFTSDKHLLKTLPKCKSEPQKDFFTTDEDSLKIGPKNTVIPSTEDTYKTPNSLYSSIIAAEKSVGFINIVKKIIPSLVSNDLPDNKDDPLDDGSLDKNFMKANLKNAHNIENPMSIAEDSQTINPKNLFDDRSDESVKTSIPDQGLFGATNSGFSSLIPKFFKTEDVMKVEVEEKKVELTEQKEETKEEKNEQKKEEKNEEKKEDDEETDKDDEDDDGDEVDGDDDDNDDTNND